jgi:hypothetical protein
LLRVFELLLLFELIEKILVFVEKIVEAAVEDVEDDSLV